MRAEKPNKERKAVMKLNLDIIYQGMKEYLPVVMTGQTQTGRRSLRMIMFMSAARTICRQLLRWVGTSC